MIKCDERSFYEGETTFCEKPRLKNMFEISPEYIKNNNFRISFVHDFCFCI